MKQTGEKIKKLRVAAGMTQGQLAQKLGVSTSTVGMYEQGRRKPDGTMLIKLCNVFSVTADSLLGVSAPQCEAADIISEMTARFRNDHKIMLNGVPMSTEDREKLLSIIEATAKAVLPKRNDQTEN